jgi:serine/threonine protein kinase
MALQSGTKLGPYEIVAPLGAGGMGEVYRARDTRLHRDVAIKVLPGHLSTNTDLKQRFEREARAISAFNHPHICTLHDVGSQDGVEFLVMELVEGETLAKRLERGPLPLKEQLRYGAEIADALDRAHRQGIMHRDLKPGNVMLTKSGAKLLDFGLAKPQALTTATQTSAPAFSAAATLTSPVSPITQQGMVVGTMQYMSPEQIEGKEVDARSDIFALGCVLYEMATGKRAFEGKSNLSIASAILEKEPEPITSIQPITPLALEHVVQRALAKSPDDRWQSASDIRAELQWIAMSLGSGQAPTRQDSRVRWKSAAPWAIAAIALIALAMGIWRSGSTEQAPVLRASILPPPEGSFVFYGDYGSEPVLSPDGKRLAFVATVKGARGIYVRDVDSDSPRLLAGTQHGSFPFWSPDSKQLGYFADGKMLRLDVDGGASSVITDAPAGRGASWSTNGTIVFAPLFRSPLYSVPAQGGEPRQVTEIDPIKHTTHRWPVFLPDGEHFIYLAANHRGPTGSQNALYVASLKGSGSQLLTKSFCNAKVQDGRLFFCRDEKLYAQPINLKTLALQGEPQILIPSVMTDPSTWRAIFSASDSGLLLYAAGEQAHGGELVIFDRAGNRLSRLGEVRDYYVLSISRDGKKLGVEVADPGANIMVGDLTRNIFSRLTFSGSSTRQPVLSPDGREIVFTSDASGGVALIRKSTGGLGQEQVLLSGNIDRVPNDWSGDGKYILVQQGENGKEYGMFALELTGQRRLIPIIVTPGEQIYDGAFSPDTKWLLYTTPVNGREEVFVSPFQIGTDLNAKEVAPSGRWQISNGGGLGRWSHDGREIYYISSSGKMMSVSVHPSSEGFEADAPKELFPISIKNIVGMPYVVTPDGKFIANLSLQPLNSPVNLVSDWHKLLKH